jgi:hypothetical protein
MSHTLVDSSRATEPVDSAAEQAVNTVVVDDHSDVEHGDDVQGGAEPSGDRQPSSAPVTRDGRNVVLMTTGLCVVFGAAGHLALLGGWASGAPGQTDNALPWQPVVGASLTAVALLSFGGFYYASLRARIAIMTSFLLTFLLLLTYVLTVRELQPTVDQTLVESLIGDFRVIVQTVVGFYFSTETVLSLTKILRAPKDDAAAIRRADRDLPAG